jgi:hypothetical protein
MQPTTILSPGRGVAAPDRRGLPLLRGSVIYEPAPTTSGGPALDPPPHTA